MPSSAKHIAKPLAALLLVLGALPALGADVEQLLAAMTLDEKLSMLHGIKDPDPAVGLNSAGYIPGVPRLGIPPLRLTDGPAGIRTDVTATALPAPIALAASFDPALARRYGETIGMEGVARNQDVLLSPMINLIRVPHAGRNFETFGEDPVLTSALVKEEILGIQDKGMMATVKHFAANNQEHDRLTIDVQVDERTLRELYFPAFEAAVQADVASVMCAYNMVNASHACENTHLLNEVLRGEWHFRGYVMTDWWAQHSLNALHNGLNMEMPGWTHPEYPVLIHFDEPLRNAVQQNTVTMTEVDNAVRPILDMMNRFGKLDGRAPPAASRETDNAAVATDVALHGAVLLKNDNATLPLPSAAFNRTLLVGPTAAWTLLGGGGSSRVYPSAHDNPKNALERLAEIPVINHIAGYDIDGTVIPQEVLRDAATNAPGLQQIAFDGTRSTVPAINYVGDQALSGAGMWYWNAELTAPEDGLYEVHMQTSGPVASLYLDDQRVLFNDSGQLSNAELIPTSDGLRNSTVNLELKAGDRHQIKVEAWTGDPRPIQMRLTWLTPSQRAAAIAQAVDAAKQAETVIVFAHQEGTEGRDRETLTLPGYQDQLIREIAKSRAGNTIVVLNVGAPITMPWVDDVDAILQMWYPGQTGGNATAQLLLGLQNPSGKLPVTFPRREEDAPTHDPMRYPGVAGAQQYSEGLFMGYRWYDQQEIEPLFPFGHGLSYTSFEYSDMTVERSGDDVQVGFTVRNTGARPGAEVPQVYLDQRNGPTPVPVEPRKLVAFSKVALAPGESQRVLLPVPARSFSWWDTDNHRWQTLAGMKTFHVGSSSRDLRLEQSLRYELPGTADTSQAP